MDLCSLLFFYSSGNYYPVEDNCEKIKSPLIVRIIIKKTCDEVWLLQFVKARSDNGVRQSCRALKVLLFESALENCYFESFFLLLLLNFADPMLFGRTDGERRGGRRKLFSAITALNKLFPIRRIKAEWNSFLFLLLHLGTNMLDSSNYCITQFLHQSCRRSAPARVARVAIKRTKQKKLKQLLFIVKEAQVCALFLGCCISP